ncbi:hypothetical protein GCM10012319_64730 [Comamonas sp. KCTC 72670]|nr:hypothetical protein GCM10012319_64730 [Comamonas sp. KCTC 72670]
MEKDSARIGGRNSVGRGCGQDMVPLLPPSWDVSFLYPPLRRVIPGAPGATRQVDRTVSSRRDRTL